MSFLTRFMNISTRFVSFLTIFINIARSLMPPLGVLMNLPSRIMNFLGTFMNPTGKFKNLLTKSMNRLRRLLSLPMRYMNLRLLVKVLTMLGTEHPCSYLSLGWVVGWGHVLWFLLALSLYLWWKGGFDSSQIHSFPLLFT